QSKIGKAQAAGAAIIRVAAAVAIEAEGTARGRRLEDTEVHDGFPLHTNLDGVAALDDTQSLDEVVDILQTTRLLLSGDPKTWEAAYTETRQAAVVRRERNARDTDLRGQIVIGVELEPLGSQARVSRPKLIHYVRRKDMRLTEHTLPGVIGPVA